MSFTPAAHSPSRRQPPMAAPTICSTKIHSPVPGGCLPCLSRAMAPSRPWPIPAPPPPNASIAFGKNLERLLSRHTAVQMAFWAIKRVGFPIMTPSQFLKTFRGKIGAALFCGFARVPDGQRIRRTLAAQAVVGQDVVGRGDHLGARKDEGFGMVFAEFEADEFVLAVPQHGHQMIQVLDRDA